MSNLKKDIIVGLLFTAGVMGFVSGEFIVSTVVFATAAIMSNIDFNRALHA